MCGGGGYVCLNNFYHVYITFSKCTIHLCTNAQKPHFQTLILNRNDEKTIFQVICICQIIRNNSSQNFNLQRIWISGCVIYQQLNGKRHGPSFADQHQRKMYSSSAFIHRLRFQDCQHIRYYYSTPTMRNSNNSCSIYSGAYLNLTITLSLVHFECHVSQSYPIQAGGRRRTANIFI